MKIQVDKKHYGFSYIHSPRWHSYLLQIKAVENLLKPDSRVLVVGVGDGVVSDYLKNRGIKVQTIDIDPELKPDFVSDVRNLSFKENAFDVVLCAEVLEHLPYEDFSKAISELGRVSKKYVILSLPDKRSTLLSFKLKIPFLKKIGIFWKAPNFRKHSFDDQHYWEVGKRGFGLGKIKREILNSGFKIIREFTKPESPTIHFFILEKNA